MIRGFYIIFTIGLLKSRDDVVKACVDNEGRVCGIWNPGQRVWEIVGKDKLLGG